MIKTWNLTAENLDRHVAVLTDLGLDCKIADALEKGGYHTIADLVNMDQIKFLKLPNMGEISMYRLIESLERYLKLVESKDG